MPAHDIGDSESRYVVAKVVDSWWYGNPKSKFQDRWLQYLVAWEEYGQEENLVEQFEMLEGTAMQTLVNFHDRYPSKPREYRVVHGPMRGKQSRS